MKLEIRVYIRVGTDAVVGDFCHSEVVAGTDRDANTNPHTKGYFYQDNRTEQSYFEPFFRGQRPGSPQGAIGPRPGGLFARRAWPAEPRDA